MPKTNRLREGLVLLVCAPGLVALVGALVVHEVVTSLVELSAGDRAGLWGSR